MGAVMPESKTVHTEPTKDFFVKMITRDISLEDCILDLLDNAIDGARRNEIRAEGPPLAGYFANIDFSREEFVISDNCNGIRLTDAIDYAFHFGRRPDSPEDVEGGIGLYGIGMKRAIFKIGKQASVFSDASDACFTVSVDVNTWLEHDDWDFSYSDSERSEVRGTRIRIAHFNEGVGAAFADPVFKNDLIKLIARDYAFFIEKGFEVRICGDLVPTYRYQMKSNADIEPSFEVYQDGDVRVRIVAGLVDELPDDIPDELTPEKVDRFGWFVVCNDRVVLAADKTSDTIWGDDGYRVWHPQYNGFAGFVFFESRKASDLPWTTTKRQIDDSSPLYRRAVERMKRITDDFVSYTNRRKADLETAKAAERSDRKVDVYAIQLVQEMRLPKLAQNAPPHTGVISYRRNLSDIQEIRMYLSNPGMTYKDIGIHTFEYFLRTELGK